MAGPVGLGWSLNAGGMITRVVRGVPDTSDGFADLSVTDENDLNDLYWDLIYGEVDGQHDIYTFSFLGISGKFFLDKDGVTVHQMPKSDILISRLNQGWEIVDIKGNVYRFGETIESRETTIHNNSNADGSYKITQCFLTNPLY